MSDTIEKRGYPVLEEIVRENGYPAAERFQKGPVAIAECIQPIPCNPCENACGFHAIRVGEQMIHPPKIDFDRCAGCGICLTKCPGLAIFLIDKSYSQEEALISFPHEYLPLPHTGQQVSAVDRSGTILCEGVVKSVNLSEANDGTPIVTLVIPQKFSDQVRGMKRLERSSSDVG